MTVNVEKMGFYTHQENRVDETNKTHSNTNENLHTVDRCITRHKLGDSRLISCTNEGTFSMAPVG